jgi:hypothetical protein
MQPDCALRLVSQELCGSVDIPSKGRAFRRAVKSSSHTGFSRRGNSVLCQLNSSARRG